MAWLNQKSSIMPHRANHTIKSLVKSINFKHFFCKTIFFVISISLISKTVKKYSSFIYKEKWYPWIYVTSFWALWAHLLSNCEHFLFVYIAKQKRKLYFIGDTKKDKESIYRLILFLLRLELLILKSTVEVFKFDTLIKAFPAGYNHHYV